MPYCLILVLALITSTLSASTEKNYDSKVILVVSLIWEGKEIREENTQAISQFRNKNPQLPLLQFLNPAYFTRKNSNHQSITASIKENIRPFDPIGLHIHPYKSLVKKSKVIFRTSPTFWGYDIKTCAVDCGHEVPLSVYTEQEVYKIANFSIKTLKKQGFRHPNSFFAGGWMASANTLAAISDLGLRYDFSSVPPSIIQNRLKHFPLSAWLQKLWTQTTILSEPKLYNGLIMVPMATATVDYMQEQEVLGIFNKKINKLKNSRKKSGVFHVGLYHETAFTQIHRLDRILKKIYASAKRQQVKIIPFQERTPVKRSNKRLTTAAKKRKNKRFERD